MSGEQTGAWLDEALAREERASDEIARLCAGGRWTMRVPVDEARDSDTVLAASLADVPKLVAAVREFAALADSYPLGSDVPVYRLHRILDRLAAGRPDEEGDGDGMP